jgi:glycosyltransferase involved in cell wall biosynthesis
MNSTRRSTTLIVPALNEEAVIGTMLSRIPPGLFDLVIVADNGSTDRTAEAAHRHGAFVVRTEQRGYGAACLRAMEALPPDCFAVVFMQADASERASEAERLLAPLLDGRADLVIGSRTLGEAEPGALLPHQVFGNWLAATLIRWIYGHRYTDLGPFRAIRAAVLRELGMKDRNYGWTVEMQVRALRAGLRVLEVPVSSGKRQAGKNKVSGNLKASLMAGWKIFYTVARVSLEKSHRIGE